jgi:hypothetical protein
MPHVPKSTLVVRGAAARAERRWRISRGGRGAARGGAQLVAREAATPPPAGKLPRLLLPRCVLLLETREAPQVRAGPQQRLPVEPAHAPPNHAGRQHKARLAAVESSVNRKLEQQINQEKEQENEQAQEQEQRTAKET